jgi:hypothetical protein
MFLCMRNQVSGRTLANLLGVSENAITRLAKRGVIAPAPKGRYHLQASVHSYCAFLRALIGGTGEVESPDEHAHE